MTAHALELVHERQLLRLLSKTRPEDPRATIREAWLEALPIDVARRLEAQVWLATSITVRSDAACRVLAEINSGLDELCAASVEVYASNDGCSPDRGAASAKVALRAFTDGLTLGGVTEPERFTAATITYNLDAYLAAALA